MNKLRQGDFRAKTGDLLPDLRDTDASRALRSASGGAMAAPRRLAAREVCMSRRRRTSAVVGLALALAFVLIPSAQAACRALPAPPGSWLEIVAGWWERAVSPLLPASRNGGEKIGTMIDPDGATTPAPPPAARTCEGCSEIGTTIDPDG